MISYDCEKQYEENKAELALYKQEGLKLNKNRYLCCGLDSGLVIFLNILSGSINEIHARLSITIKPVNFIIEVGRCFAAICGR